MTIKALQRRNALAKEARCQAAGRLLRLLAAASAASCLATAGFAGAATDAPAVQTTPAETPSVTTATVAWRAIRDKLFYPGRLEERTVDVISPLEGVVASTQKDMGEAVKRGDTLALISNDNPAFSDQPQPLLAPAGGVVQFWFVHQGERVQKATRVATLAVGVQRLIVELTGSDASRARVGQKAWFTPSSGESKAAPPVAGQITALSPTIDPMTNTRRCEITLARAAAPTSGSVGSVLIETLPRQAVLIQEAAVRGKDKSSYVYILQDGKTVVRPVVLGGKVDGDVEVQKGLQPGDVLVVKSSQALREGQQVLPATRQASNP